MHGAPSRQCHVMALEARELSKLWQAIHTHSR